MLFDSYPAWLLLCPWLLLCCVFVTFCISHSPQSMPQHLSKSVSAGRTARYSSDTETDLQRFCRQGTGTNCSQIRQDAFFSCQTGTRAHEDTWIIGSLIHQRCTAISATAAFIKAHFREFSSVCFQLFRCRSWARWAWWQWRFQRSWAELGWTTWRTAWPWRRSAGAVPVRGWWYLWTTWALPSVSV